MEVLPTYLQYLQKLIMIRIIITALGILESYFVGGWAPDGGE